MFKSKKIDEIESTNGDSVWLDEKNGNVFNSATNERYDIRKISKITFEILEYKNGKEWYWIDTKTGFKFDKHKKVSSYIKPSQDF